MAPVHPAGEGDAQGPPSREEELDRALSKGALEELPPNQPRGLLGERNPQLRVVDEWKPDLNAGVSQEMDLPVVWMAIVLAYLVFFPVAYVILWRTRLISMRAKAAVSVLGAVGVGFVLYRIVLG